jgi:hypothetical protein
MRSVFVLLAAAILASVASNARAGDFCSTCEVQLGLGGTYHWVGWSHGIVAPIIFTFDDDRWELGAFRFTKGQDFHDSTFGVDVHFADPYWGSRKNTGHYLQRPGPLIKPSRIGCLPPGGISTRRSGCGSSRPGA